MANKMDFNTKGSSNKAILSISKGEDRNENSLNHKTNGGAFGTWRNKRIPSQI
jgi:hypothetical protein